MLNQHARLSLSNTRTFFASLGVVLAIGGTAPAHADFVFQKIVDTDTLVPGGGGAYFSFNGSVRPAVSGTNVVFGTQDQTVWTAKIDGASARRVFTTDTPIPGNLGNFHQYYADYAQVYGSKVVVVGTSCGGCNSGVGIYARKLSGGPITTLADINTLVPGSATEKFSTFPNDFDVGYGQVAFTNQQHVFSVPLAGGTITPVAGLQNQGSSPPSPFCCIFDQPTIRKDRILMRAGNVFGRGSLQDADLDGNTTGFRFLVTGSNHAPGTPAAYRYDNFDFDHPVYDAVPVFYGDSTAEGQPYIGGIYARGRKIIKLADTNTPVPEGSGNFVFGWYGTRSPIAAGKGIVVFGARDGLDNPGIYAVRENGGAITKVIARGDTLEGHTVVDLDMSRAGFDGTTLVFRATYANFQGLGLYSTTVALP